MKQIMEFRDQMMKKGEANSQDGTKLSLDEDAPIEEQVRQVFDQVIEAQKTQAKLQTQMEQSEILLEDQMDRPTSRAFVPAEELVGELAPVVGVVMNEELHREQPPANTDVEKDLDEMIEHIMEMEQDNSEDSAYRNNLRGTGPKVDQAL